MERGTIVLTRFPFTDLSSSKRRPAVVISKVEKNQNDVIVAFISTKTEKKLTDTDLIIDVKSPSFRGTGLKTKSVFKMSKVATLDKTILTGEIGNVDSNLMGKLEKLALALK